VYNWRRGFLDKVNNTLFNLKMQVSFPSHHSWLKDISAGIEIDFSGRAAKKIHASLPLLEASNITYTIEPLSGAFFADFMPLYTAHIGGKQNSLLHDVEEKTLHKVSSFSYYSFSLRENGVFIGGTIFSLRTDRISYAYRAFQTDWTDARLKASPAMIGEYVVAQFASEQGKQFLSHGKDRNPYGLNAAIGLATFKLSVGCKASVSKGAEVRTIDTDTITEDCLILTMPEEGTSITKAYLVTTPESLDKHIQVTKYPDLLEVEVLFR
jgi:hypothetical protein